jgi:hypothetical protein
LFLVRQVVVRQVEVDTPICKPHSAMMMEVMGPAAVQFTSAAPAPEIKIPENWEAAWDESWLSVASSWQQALEADDVESAWRIWCSTLEASVGIPAEARCRFLGRARRGCGGGQTAPGSRWRCGVYTGCDAERSRRKVSF